MKPNPILSEGIQIYLWEGQSIPAYGYLLLILAPFEFLTLFLPSLDPQAWAGAANLFKVSSAVALLLMLYLGLRIANREYVPWRFLPLRQWVRENGVPISRVALAQVGLLSVHIGLFILVSAPLLIWAGAISRSGLFAVFAAFGLLFFYSLAYGVWGLAAAVFWERRLESRQVFVRCFFFALLIVSALVYLPLNPVAFLLSYLGRRELAPLVLGGWHWPAPALHFFFHFSLFVSGLLAFRWALRRETIS